VTGARDILAEAVAALVARPARTALTAFGTVLGIAALVATIGLAQSGGQRVLGRFDELAATQVVVTPKPPTTTGGAAVTTAPLPWDVEARLLRLRGVRGAGAIAPVDVGGAGTVSVPAIDPLGQAEHHLPVYAVSPGLWRAVRATTRAGRMFDAGHDRRGDAVAVLGRAAASELGITELDAQPAVTIGDRTMTVVGIVDHVEREAALLGGVLLPPGLVDASWHLPAPQKVYVETAVGAASLIARQAPVALSPTDPRGLAVELPAEPRRIRAGIKDDLTSLFLALGGLSLLIGALGIANVTLVSVIERAPEIGLRRAIGARRGHIAAQFLLESALVGLLGGVVGTSLGVLVVVVATAVQGWPAVLPSVVPAVAPALGAVVGLCAGAYPSRRAARMEPIAALRSGAR
jgi:hypothetical protein